MKMTGCQMKVCQIMIFYVRRRNCQGSKIMHSFMLTHVNVNSLQNEAIVLFKQIIHEGFMDALFIHDSKLNDKITKKDVPAG